MGSLASISFIAPLALVGLLGLPILWWLLRATPPQPSSTFFPPLRLLADLTNKEETPVRTPWWLLLLRLVLLTLLIFAFAGPVWLASDPVTLPGSDDQTLLIVVETDWTRANDWDVQQPRLERLIEAADLADRAVGILAAPQPNVSLPLPGDSVEARAGLANIAPQPAPQDEEALQNTVEATLRNTAWQDAAIVWLPSGVKPSEDHQAWFNDLAERRTIAVLQPGAPELVLSLSAGADGPAVIPTPVGDTSALLDRNLVAYDSVGRQLAQRPLVEETTQEGQSLPARLAFDLPLDLRNDIARIAITPTHHVGEVVLVDDRQERRRVGIVGADGSDEAQPLLSGTTYVERALRPFADVTVPRSGDTASEITTMIEEGVSVILLIDIASLIPSTTQMLEDWIESGGVLIRFASTSLTQSEDQLIPVPLRSVDRQLGGALTWEEPQTIAPFGVESPFAGLTIPQDVRIERQVLSEPGAALASRTLAELSDATPLVTGEPRGDGHLVLFHITADTRWSNLPLSGLFVDMLERLVQLSSSSLGAAALQDGTSPTALTPRATLDAFGSLGSPPLFAEGLVITANEPSPSLSTPPGFYGPADAQRALNLFSEPPELLPFDAEGLQQLGVESLEVGSDESVSLRPSLLTLAMVLALADAVIVLILSGAFSGLSLARGGTTAGIAVLTVSLSVGVVAEPAHAQDSTSNNGELAHLMAAANTTRLAYVLTGDAEIDRRSQEGLFGITRILTQRTAFEPAEPFAVDPAQDELAFYPLIYWPMPSEPIDVTDQLVTRIDAYMNNGGTILFDTRDETSNFATASISPETANLRALLSALDIPPLEPVPDDHVLTKAFYLIDVFPGRFASGPLWVEALPDDTDGTDRPARGGDGVSPIMITGNDFASAWALSADGRPLYATSPPDRIQREFAFRTGVNIGMYVMTGNYKADQVHVPALLERLVQ